MFVRPARTESVGIHHSSILTFRTGQTRGPLRSHFSLVAPPPRGEHGRRPTDHATRGVWPTDVAHLAPGRRRSARPALLLRAGADGPAGADDGRPHAVRRRPARRAL